MSATTPTGARVEVDVRTGIPSFTVLGAPDGRVREARERIRAAIVNAGFEFPLDKRITVNLVPASLRRELGALEPTIAASVLYETGQIVDSEVAYGELHLDGRELRGLRRAGEAGLVQALRTIDAHIGLEPSGPTEAEIRREVRLALAAYES